MTLSRREWIKAAALVALASRRGFAAGFEGTSPAPIAITVYKTPTCECCRKWVAYLEKNGFAPTVHDLLDLSETKATLRVPAALESCHTAIIGKQVVEGHVPADVIKKMLADKRHIDGIAVPGMVDGSPGMETGRKDAYDVIAYMLDGTRWGYAHR